MTHRSGINLRQAVRGEGDGCRGERAGPRRRPAWCRFDRHRGLGAFDSFGVVGPQGVAHTNRCWKIRNRTTSEAITNIVAAEIIKISTPFSGAAKIDRTTVRGRVVCEFGLISGHRKLFQCDETETSALARSVSRAASI